MLKIYGLVRHRIHQDFWARLDINFGKRHHQLHQLQLKRNIVFRGYYMIENYEKIDNFNKYDII